jgi:hypothetical protein
LDCARVSAAFTFNAARIRQSQTNHIEKCPVQNKPKFYSVYSTYSAVKFFLRALGALCGDKGPRAHASPTPTTNSASPPATAPTSPAISVQFDSHSCSKLPAILQEGMEHPWGGTPQESFMRRQGMTEEMLAIGGW